VLVLRDRLDLELAGKLDVYVIPIGEEQEVKRAAVWAASQLRRAGLAVDVEYLGRSVRKAMRVAGERARHVLLIGPDELSQGEVKFKDLASGEERALALDELSSPDRLRTLFLPQLS